MPTLLVDSKLIPDIDLVVFDKDGTLIVLPVSVFAFFVRKTIVQGLTMGALKD